MVDPVEPLYTKLKPGPGRLPHDVCANQRTRLYGAVVELAAEVGYEGLTVRGVSRAAGVSTATFYKHFENVEDCFASTYESLARRCLRRAHAAREACDGWEEGMRAVLRSLMEEAACHPKEARLLSVESFAAGPRTRSRMKSGTSILERLLGDAPGTDAPVAPTRRQIARGVAAGLTRVVRTRLLANESAHLMADAAEIEAWALSLFGAGLDRLELSRPHLDSRGGTDSRDGLNGAIVGATGDERVRILTAVAKLSLADGYSQLTVPKIRAQAGVSRRGFGSRFANVEQCFLDAIEAIATSVAARAQLSARRARGWEAANYRAVQTLCIEAALRPALARLSLVDIFTPGREGLGRRERLVSMAAALLQSTSPPGKRPSALQAEAAVAAAWSVAHREVETARAVDLPRQAPLFAYMTMAPTLGSEAAAEAIEVEQKRRPA